MRWYRYDDSMYQTNFLVGFTGLSEQSVDEIVLETIKCHVEDTAEMTLDDEYYTAKITNTRKYRLLGDIGGRLYEVIYEAEGVREPQEMSFIIGKKNRPNLN